MILQSVTTLSVFSIAICTKDPPIRKYTETLHTYTFYYFLFVLVLELLLCQSVNNRPEIIFLNMAITIKICNKYC